MGEFLGAAWHWLIESVPAPPARSMLVAFFLGVVLVFVRLTGRPLHRLDTWVHESGHAVVAILCGHRVSSVRIDGDGSGATTHVGSGGRFSRLLISASGHLAPAVLSFALVYSVVLERPHLVIATLLVLSIVVLLVSRTAVAVTSTAGVIGVATAFALIPGEFADLGMLMLAGILATTGLWSVAASSRSRRARKTVSLAGPRQSDQESMADLTRMPAGFWETILMLTCTFMAVASIAVMASSAAEYAVAP